MTEKMTSETQATPKVERFEFKLTVNDNIICQRYFRINGFRREAYNSINLLETIDSCVDLIDKDLKEKSAIYLENAAPLSFETVEDMEDYVAKHPQTKNGVPEFAVITTTNEVFTVFDGEITPYEKHYDISDSTKNDSEIPCVLKFAFLDNGREIISKTWDGNVYPRFVRTNIDLSNSKNKYRINGIFAPVESAILDKCIASQPDLIPQIVRQLCTVCSKEDVDEYDTTIDFGNKTYNLDIRKENHKLYRSLEAQYRKKTAEYFRGL
jgi:hypothetical protein